MYLCYLSVEWKVIRLFFFTDIIIFNKELENLKTSNFSSLLAFLMDFLLGKFCEKFFYFQIFWGFVKNYLNFCVISFLDLFSCFSVHTIETFFFNWLFNFSKRREFFKEMSWKIQKKIYHFPQNREWEKSTFHFSRKCKTETFFFDKTLNFFILFFLKIEKIFIDFIFSLHVFQWINHKI